MSTASRELANFAVGLSLADVPEDVLQRARTCIADAIGCAVYGSSFPWSVQIQSYARRYGMGGGCTIIGSVGAGVHAPYAALANGAAVHAFEQDSLRFPGAGVHPGAALVPTIAAACQDIGASGATALRAFVAGCEALFRIGSASGHSSEKLGFHAPGLTGVYGATIAAGIVYGLDEPAITGAMGSAGSLSAGLLAFSKASSGAAVKRLHMGRACEAGILAARLAESGFAGPETVLEGRFGFLEAYCRDGDPALLTSGLGTEWETRHICLKRYACHATAQAPIQALRTLLSEYRIAPAEVRGIEIQCSPKVLSHHDIRRPSDVMQAQYSVPFCVALALHRDPLDPLAFREDALRDPSIRATCETIRLQPRGDLPSSWSSIVALILADGRRVEQEAYRFKGMPGTDLSPEAERQRFLALSARLGPTQARSLHEAVMALEDQRTFPIPVVQNQPMQRS